MAAHSQKSFTSRKVSPSVAIKLIILFKLVTHVAKKKIRNLKDSGPKYSSTITVINHTNILIIIIAMSGFTYAIVALAQDIAPFTIINNNVILNLQK